MTLVSPVNESPQPVNVPALSQPAAVQIQRQQDFTPDEVRSSITSVLRRLPATSNAQPLRDAFLQMQAKLVGVNDQEQVYTIVNDHMLSLSDQVLSAPNPVELLQLLQDAEEEPSQPQASSLLNSRGGQWGWLS
ncbi:MAG: hypothetical protein AAF329_21640 [Cyanobacteria bacterium P01_A01_bin.17]